MTKDRQKMQKATISYKNHHKIDGKFSRQRRFVLRGWIRIRSISDRIRNPARAYKTNINYSFDLESSLTKEIIPVE